MRTALGILIALAACGDDDVTLLPDGPPVPDAPPDTSEEGLVTLTVTSEGSPRMGVKVYFQNADSSEVSATMTDVNGLASAVMEPGGFVTAIDPFPPRAIPQGVADPTDVRTFAGVKPGDQLVLTRNNPGDTSEANVTLSVPVFGGATNYFLFAPCLAFGLDITSGGGSGSGSGTPGGPVFFFGCGAATDLTVVATDGITELAAIHKTNVAITEGATIDLTADAYVATEDASWTYNDAPASVSSVAITDVTTTAAGAQFLISTGDLFTEGDVIVTGRDRPAIGGALQIVGSEFNGPPNSFHSMLEWGPVDNTYEKTLTNVLLAEYATTPTYDVANKTVNWTVGAGATPDFAIAGTFFRRDDGAGTITDWTWQIAAPLGAEMSVRYPVLPAPDATLNPVVTDVIFDVEDLLTAKVPGGYDAIREQVLAIQGDPNTGLPVELVTGATGTVVFETLQFGKTKPARATTASAKKRTWLPSRAERAERASRKPHKAYRR